MTLRWGTLGTLVVACATWGGCQQGVDSFPPPPQCISDAGLCTQHSGGAAAGGNATSTTTTTTSSGAGGGTTQLTGTVALITSPDFTGGAQYQGMANIVAPGPAGSVTVPYGGAAGTTFDLTGISSGPQWLLVQDTTGGGANIYSTFSLANLPIATPVTLPVVELGVLTSIANSLPSVSSQGVSNIASQIVISVTHAGQPYKGVSLNGSAGGATVAYDTGSGVYSDTATATGSSGIIILFNSGLSGGSLIGLNDTNTSTLLSVQVMAAPGAVSLVAAPL